MAEAERALVEPEEAPADPFVRRVRLRNYKSIGTCDVALDRLTLLVGRNGAGKMWIEARFNRRHRTTGQRYSPPVDMPKLVARLDPALARERCPSFDKLCRELEAWGR